jgi:hypothetical protein
MDGWLRDAIEAGRTEAANTQRIAKERDERRRLPRLIRRELAKPPRRGWLP